MKREPMRRPSDPYSMPMRDPSVRLLNELLQRQSEILTLVKDLSHEVKRLSTILSAKIEAGG